MKVRELAQYELKALAELGAPIVVRTQRAVAQEMEMGRPLPPTGMDEVERAKWEEEQEAKEAKLEAEERAERAKWEAAEQLRREQAASDFKKALEELLTTAFEAGAESAVSSEVHRAVTVRGYVLLGVVAAVVAMPLIGMLLQLDPQTFGAFIAPITGITGTIVGYWFGTVGQGSTRSQDQK
jgi:hypothetical protein